MPNVEALLADVEICFTYLQTAQTHSNGRNLLQARREVRARYDSIMGELPPFRFGDHDSRVLEVRLALLKVRLKQLGDDDE